MWTYISEFKKKRELTLYIYEGWVVVVAIYEGWGWWPFIRGGWWWPFFDYIYFLLGRLLLSKRLLKLNN